MEKKFAWIYRKLFTLSTFAVMGQFERSDFLPLVLPLVIKPTGEAVTNHNPNQPYPSQSPSTNRSSPFQPNLLSTDIFLPYHLNITRTKQQRLKFLANPILNHNNLTITLISS